MIFKPTLSGSSFSFLGRERSARPNSSGKERSKYHAIALPSGLAIINARTAFFASLRGRVTAETSVASSPLDLFQHWKAFLLAIDGV